MEGLLHCLCAKYVWYAKGDTIIEEGNKVYDFGIMLSGHGRAIKRDRVILISLLKKRKRDWGYIGGKFRTQKSRYCTGGG